MTFKEALQEKYKLVCEDTKEWQWPMVMNTYYVFTGNVSPDGESGEYKIPSDNSSTRLWFNKRGTWHNNFGPAYTNSVVKHWVVNGKRHRLDGPAIEFTNSDIKHYYINNVEYSKEDFDKKVKEIKGLQQAGEPYGVDLNDLEESTEGWQWPKVWGKEKNYIFTGEVTPDGESGKYEWHAWAQYGNTTSKIVVWWNKKGQVHNNFGPAYINPGSKMWLVNGVRHRMDGPAIEGPNKDTNEYYINGVEYTKEDYVKKVREMEALKKAGEPYGVDLNDL